MCTVGLELETDVDEAGLSHISLHFYDVEWLLEEFLKWHICFGLHEGAELSITVRRPWFKSRLGLFCVEFAGSPCACVGFPWTLQLPPTIQKMLYRLIGNSKVSLVTIELWTHFRVTGSLRKGYSVLMMRSHRTSECRQEFRISCDTSRNGHMLQLAKKKWSILYLFFSRQLTILQRGLKNKKQRSRNTSEIKLFLPEQK